MMTVKRIWSVAAAGAIVLAAPVHAQVAAAEPAVAPVHVQAAAAEPAVAPVHVQAADAEPTVGPVHVQVAGAEPAVAPVHAQVAAAEPAVAPYYAAHPGAVLWLSSADARAATAKLATILRQATLDGLADGPALADGVDAALASSQAADDQTVSAAWVRYVQAIRRPVDGISYADPALAIRPPTPETILVDAARAPSLAAHVEQVSAVNPFYAALRDDAAKAGGTPDPRVLATLDRLRLLPAKGRAIIVDIPAAKLMMIEDGRVVDTMKVIVGKKSGATPILASSIHYVTFNPVWHIPQDIARVRVAPVVLKRGVGYLTLARYQTVEGFGGDKEQPIDPITVDWAAVRDGKAEVHVRQLSGPQNMMGKVKFGFVNDTGVFLHDTPHKELFAKDRRFLSHGCIRLERPEALASWLLGGKAPEPSGEPEQLVPLDKGVPIYLTYLTAQPADDGTIAFAEDIYGLDTPGAEKAVTATAATAQ